MGYNIPIDILADTLQRALHHETIDLEIISPAVANDLAEKMPDRACQLEEELSRSLKETGAKMPVATPDYQVGR